MIATRTTGFLHWSAVACAGGGREIRQSFRHGHSDRPGPGVGDEVILSDMSAWSDVSEVPLK